MTILTFGQAVRLTSLGKTTLARAIKSGRLGRVYPFPAPVEAANATNAAINDHVASLEVEIAALRDMAALLREQLDDTRCDRDHWRDQAQRLAPLPPPVAAPPLPMLPPPASAPQPPMLWWKWLRLDRLARAS
jgi:hypothetical protein